MFALLIKTVLELDLEQSYEKIAILDLGHFRSLDRIHHPFKKSFQTNDVYLISENRQYLERNISRFEKNIKGILEYGQIELIDDFCSCNDQLSGEIADIKRSAFEISQEIWSYAEDLPQYILNGKSPDELQEKIMKLQDNEYDSLKATLMQAYNVAFEVSTF